MWTVLEWPQSHAISKTINMLTNKSEQLVPVRWDFNIRFSLFSKIYKSNDTFSVLI